MSLHEFDRIAIVGATGAVGTEALRLLEQRAVPAERIVALASAKSQDAEVAYADGVLRVRETTDEAFEGVDLALFCASAAVSRRFIPALLDPGRGLPGPVISPSSPRCAAPKVPRPGAHRPCIVVDNSSAFRMQEGVPLVVPEVNQGLIDDSASLIANPNCSTILLLVALEPLRRAFGIERIVVSTYQAVSGAGAKGMQELVDQTREALRDEVDPVTHLAVCGGAARPGASGRGPVFPEPCAFNVFSHNSTVDAGTGLNVEEQKLIDETRKIWDDRAVAISPTCVRVPVLRAHSESVTVTLKHAATEAEVRAALREGHGVEVIDDRAGNCFPTPRKASGKDEVLVGRVRKDPGAPVEGRGFQLWLCGDQLRKGAALNAVQIAELAGARRALKGTVGAA